MSKSITVEISKKAALKFFTNEIICVISYPVNEFGFSWHPVVDVGQASDDLCNVCIRSVV